MASLNITIDETNFWKCRAATSTTELQVFMLAMLTPWADGFSAEFFSLFNFISAAILHQTFGFCLFCFKMFCRGEHHQVSVKPEHPRGLCCTGVCRLQGLCLCSPWIFTTNSSWKSCSLSIFGHLEKSTLAHQNYGLFRSTGFLHILHPQWKENLALKFREGQEIVLLSNLRHTRLSHGRFADDSRAQTWLLTWHEGLI